MSQYIFDDHPDAREFRRLQLIERAMDPASTALLEQTGLAAGQSCLEIGAGAGSLVDWMAGRVGSGGRVFALDKKAVHLRRFIDPPVQVIEGGLQDLALDRPVDLAHARYVFIHNSNAGALLRHVRTLLNRGAYFVVEEPDFTCAARLQPNPKAAVDRVNGAIEKMFLDAGLDPAYGLRLPQEVRDAGFDLLCTDSRLHLAPGGAPIAEVMAESALALRAAYRKTGLATDAEIDQYVARARDPRVWAVYYATVAVLARAV